MPTGLTVLMLADDTAAMSAAVAPGILVRGYGQVIIR